MEYVHYGYQMKKRYAKLTVDFKAGSDNKLRYGLLVIKDNKGFLQLYI